MISNYYRYYKKIVTNVAKFKGGQNKRKRVWILIIVVIDIIIYVDVIVELWLVIFSVSNTKNYKNLIQIRKASKLQKIVTNVGATNEQTNENKVQGKNKTKFLY